MLKNIYIYYLNTICLGRTFVYNKIILSKKGLSMHCVSLSNIMVIDTIIRVSARVSLVARISVIDAPNLNYTCVF